MALTGVQISQTEVQRLHGALSGGASIKDAAQAVFDFFATPIDWDAERKAFAEWLAKRSCGKLRGTVVVTMNRKV